MQFKNTTIKKIFIYLIFSSIFLLGISIYKDYGLTFDDDDYRINGEFYYEYIKILFDSDSTYSLSDFHLFAEDFFSNSTLGTELINHPVFFELLLTFLVKLFNINSINEIYEFSHFLNFFIFFISLIFFYKFIKKKFNSEYYGLFSIIILFFTPRIFAESFYNSRDIFFLSLFILNICSAYYFLLNENFKTAIIFSLTSAILINAKIVGIIPPFLFLLFYSLNITSGKNIKKNSLKFIFLIFSSMILFIYVTSPYLWIDPLTSLISFFRDMVQAQNNIQVLNFYQGEFINSNNVPWHYRIVWFLITTPVFILFFFFVGLTLILFELIKNFMRLNDSNDELWNNVEQLFSFYLLTILIIIVFSTIKFNISQFGGWRHLYFLYPVIITLSLSGLKFVYKVLNNFNFKFMLSTIITVNLFYIFFWNFTFHPHQQVYFNFIFKNYSMKNFDLDYWGLTNIHSLRHILKNNDNYPIKIGTISFSSLDDSLLLLDEIEKKNIIITYDLEKADFLISNYMKRLRKNFIIDKNKYSKYFEIIVDGVPINTVYKKIN